MSESPGAFQLPHDLYAELRPDYQQLLGYLITAGALRRDHAVLDVGCGHGRMARELLTFLNPTTTYDGFDVRPQVITKLQRRLSSFPHFRFHHANIFNKRYNPEGAVAASEYVFPFADASFDLVFLLSIFTHMFPEDMSHYLGEISRVLRPGRRCLITYFLLNDESRGYIDAGAIKKSFPHRGDRFRYQSAEEPEHAIAVDEDYILETYKSHGLRLAEPILYGRWCGRSGQLRQDLVVAVKETP